MEAEITHHPVLQTFTRAHALRAYQLRQMGRAGSSIAHDRTELYTLERAAESDSTPLVTVDYDDPIGTGF